MKMWQWISTAVVTAGMASILIGCSADSGSPTASIDSLERSVYTDGPIEYQPDCSIVAKDIFGNGGAGMPFEIGCENMSSAQSGVTRMRYNWKGCLIEVQGWVRFTDNGHRYSFQATTRGCSHDGGILTVCSPVLGGCREVSLPVALSSTTSAQSVQK
jgi:hypothetical protein